MYTDDCHLFSLLDRSLSSQSQNPCVLRINRLGLIQHPPVTSDGKKLKSWYLSALPLWKKSLGVWVQ